MGRRSLGVALVAMLLGAAALPAVQALPVPSEDVDPCETTDNPLGLLTEGDECRASASTDATGADVRTSATPGVDARAYYPVRVAPDGSSASVHDPVTGDVLADLTFLFDNAEAVVACVPAGADGVEPQPAQEVCAALLVASGQVAALQATVTQNVQTLQQCAPAGASGAPGAVSGPACQALVDAHAAVALAQQEAAKAIALVLANEEAIAGCVPDGDPDVAVEPAAAVVCQAVADANAAVGVALAEIAKAQALAVGNAEAIAGCVPEGSDETMPAPASSVCAALADAYAAAAPALAALAEAQANLATLAGCAPAGDETPEGPEPAATACEQLFAANAELADALALVMSLPGLAQANADAIAACAPAGADDVDTEPVASQVCLALHDANAAIALVASEVARTQQLVEDNADALQTCAPGGSEANGPEPAATVCEQLLAANTAVQTLLAEVAALETLAWDNVDALVACAPEGAESEPVGPVAEPACESLFAVGKAVAPAIAAVGALQACVPDGDAGSTEPVVGDACRALATVNDEAARVLLEVERLRTIAQDNADALAACVPAGDREVETGPAADAVCEALADGNAAVANAIAQLAAAPGLVQANADAIAACLPAGDDAEPTGPAASAFCAALFEANGHIADALDAIADAEDNANAIVACAPAGSEASQPEPAASVVCKALFDVNATLAPILANVAAVQALAVRNAEAIGACVPAGRPNEPEQPAAKLVCASLYDANAAVAKALLDVEAAMDAAIANAAALQQCAPGGATGVEPEPAGTACAALAEANERAAEAVDSVSDAAALALENALAVAACAPAGDDDVDTDPVASEACAALAEVDRQLKPLRDAVAAALDDAGAALACATAPDTEADGPASDAACGAIADAYAALWGASDDANETIEKAGSDLAKAISDGFAIAWTVTENANETRACVQEGAPSSDGELSGPACWALDTANDTAALLASLAVATLEATRADANATIACVADAEAPSNGPASQVACAALSGALDALWTATGEANATLACAQTPGAEGAGEPSATACGAVETGIGAIEQGIREGYATLWTATRNANETRACIQDGAPAGGGAVSAVACGAYDGANDTLATAVDLAFRTLWAANDDANATVACALAGGGAADGAASEAACAVADDAYAALWQATSQANATVANATSDAYAAAWTATRNANETRACVQNGVREGTGAASALVCKALADANDTVAFALDVASDTLWAASDDANATLVCVQNGAGAPDGAASGAVCAAIEGGFDALWNASGEANATLACAMAPGADGAGEASAAACTVIGTGADAVAQAIREGYATLWTATRNANETRACVQNGAPSGEGAVSAVACSLYEEANGTLAYAVDVAFQTLWSANDDANATVVCVQNGGGAPDGASSGAVCATIDGAYDALWNATGEANATLACAMAPGSDGAAEPSSTACTAVATGVDAIEKAVQDGYATLWVATGNVNETRACVQNGAPAGAGAVSAVACTVYDGANDTLVFAVGAAFSALWTATDDANATLVCVEQGAGAADGAASGVVCATLEGGYDALWNATGEANATAACATGAATGAGEPSASACKAFADARAALAMAVAEGYATAWTATDNANETRACIQAGAEEGEGNVSAVACWAYDSANDTLLGTVDFASRTLWAASDDANATLVCVRQGDGATDGPLSMATCETVRGTYAAVWAATGEANATVACALAPGTDGVGGPSTAACETLATAVAEGYATLWLATGNLNETRACVQAGAEQGSGAASAVVCEAYDTANDTVALAVDLAFQTLWSASDDANATVACAASAGGEPDGAASALVCAAIEGGFEGLWGATGEANATLACARSPGAEGEGDVSGPACTAVAEAARAVEKAIRDGYAIAWTATDNANETRACIQAGATEGDAAVSSVVCQAYAETNATVAMALALAQAALWAASDDANATLACAQRGTGARDGPASEAACDAVEDAYANAWAATGQANATSACVVALGGEGDGEPSATACTLATLARTTAEKAVSDAYAAAWLATDNANETLACASAPGETGAGAVSGPACVAIDEADRCEAADASVTCDAVLATYELGVAQEGARTSVRVDESDDGPLGSHVVGVCAPAGEPTAAVDCVDDADNDDRTLLQEAFMCSDPTDPSSRDPPPSAPAGCWPVARAAAIVGAVASTLPMAGSPFLGSALQTLMQGLATGAERERGAEAKPGFFSRFIGVFGGNEG